MTVQIHREEPTGTKNGVNTAFTLTETPIGSILLQLNEIILMEDSDYSITDLAITYLSEPPNAADGDVLMAYFLADV